MFNGFASKKKAYIIDNKKVCNSHIQMDIRIGHKVKIFVSYINGHQIPLRT